MSSAPATLQDPDSAADLTCESCGAPRKQATVTVCPHCGWYASLGRSVEVSREFEAAFNPDVAAEPSQPKSHAQVWLEALPLWGWVLVGVVLAIQAACLAGRLTLAEREGVLTLWSVSQLIVGGLLAAGCHVLAFVMVAADDADIGMLDTLLRPTRAWRKIFAELPFRAIIVQGAVVGVALVFGSTVVLQHIPYERLLDWGIKAPAKSSLVGAIVDQAKAADAEQKSLEEAMDEFAGGNGDEDDEEDKKPKKVERQKRDCLIVGVKFDDAEHIVTLHLAIDVLGKLRYAGEVTPTLPDEEAREFAKRLRSATAKKPFVSTKAEATWLRPRFACRVSYTRQTDDGVMQGIRWEELLPELGLPW